MTLNELLPWTAAVGWGLAVGGFYFYGLWWTLRKLSGKARPRRWLATSYAVRLTVAMAAFGLAMHGGLTPFFLMLGAFFLMRVLLTRRLAVPKAAEASGLGRRAERSQIFSD